MLSSIRMTLRKPWVGGTVGIVLLRMVGLHHEP